MFFYTKVTKIQIFKLLVQNYNPSTQFLVDRLLWWQSIFQNIVHALANISDFVCGFVVKDNVKFLNS